MNLKIWKAKRLLKRIEKTEKRLKKFQSMVSKIKKWLKKDNKELQELLNSMSVVEFQVFAVKTGYINPQLKKK